MEYDIDDRYTLRDVKVAGTEEEKQKLVKRLWKIYAG